eukprot:TRINITY_DN58687_c0_g1_i1.p2 TRINITY_DN58687_c0_g1~~TRINITY_DN58687_c0_g1_i1.p2  ORF type:complete len:266 (+),score=32.96 TRINITY_DN58687_c0_g1_i1:51-800(+)
MSIIPPNARAWCLAKGVSDDPYCCIAAECMTANGHRITVSSLQECFTNYDTLLLSGLSEHDNCRVLLEALQGIGCPQITSNMIALVVLEDPASRFCLGLALVLFNKGAMSPQALKPDLRKLKAHNDIIAHIGWGKTMREQAASIGLEGAEAVGVEPADIQHFFESFGAGSHLPGSTTRGLHSVAQHSMTVALMKLGGRQHEVGAAEASLRNAMQGEDVSYVFWQLGVGCSMEDVGVELLKKYSYIPFFE